MSTKSKIKTGEEGLDFELTIKCGFCIPKLIPWLRIWISISCFFSSLGKDRIYYLVETLETLTVLFSQKNISLFKNEIKVFYIIGISLNYHLHLQTWDSMNLFTSSLITSNPLSYQIFGSHVFTNLEKLLIPHSISCDPSLHFSEIHWKYCIVNSLIGKISVKFWFVKLTFKTSTTG